MKHAGKTIIFVFVLLVLVGTQSNLSTLDTHVDTVVISPTSEHIIAADPITIKSDDDFTVAGFTGSGTEGNPYVFTGKKISVPSNGIGFDIESTRAYFVIDNTWISSLFGGLIGIELKNVSNGIINKMLIWNFDYGLKITNSTNIEITYNTIHDIDDTGVYVKNTVDVDIWYNDISDITFTGIHDDGTSEGLTLVENLIQRVNYDGVLGTSYCIHTESDNVNITRNEIRSVDGEGLFHEYGSSSDIVYNRIWNASWGIHIANADYPDIYNNEISCIMNAAILVSSSSDSDISYNRIYHSEYGVYFSDCISGIVFGNTVFRCGFGIWMGNPTRANTIYFNQIGWCSSRNAQDDSLDSIHNVWYDFTIGNQWSDFVGNPYSIYGDSGRTDPYGSLLSDSTSPLIDHPSDIIIADTDVGIHVTWNPTDNFPDYYELYIQDVGLLDTGAWCNDSLSFLLDDFAVGEYNLVLVVYDCGGQSAGNVVHLTVEETVPPVITHHDDFSEEAFSDTLYINWTVYESHPHMYQVFINGTLYKSQTYSDGGNCYWNALVPSQYLGKGIWNFTILANDTSGNTATDLTWVTVVDTTKPTINSWLSDYSVEAHIDAAWINLTLAEDYPDRLLVWRNGYLIWNNTYSSPTYIFNFNVGTLNVGVYNFTMLATDEDSNFNSQTLWISSFDSTSPTVSDESNFTVEAGSATESIIWSWDEWYPQNYSIYKNGTEIEFGEDFNGDIVYDIDGLNPGLWNLTLVIYDESGNFGFDTTWITSEDTTNPTIISLSDFSVALGMSINLNWTLINIQPWDYDGFYSITLNGSEIDSDIWDSSFIYYQTVPLPPGLYVFELSVYDSSNNLVMDTVEVGVIDFVAPTIDTAPDDLNFNEGDSDQYLIWEASDLDPDIYIIQRDGIEIYRDFWSDTVIEFNVTDTPPGTYMFNITFFDGSGNSVSDIAYVTVNAIVTTTSTTTTTTTTSETATSETTATTEDTTSNTPSPDDGGLMIMAIAGIGGVAVVIVIIVFMKKGIIGK